MIPLVLEQVVNAPHDYDHDTLITISYNERGYPSGLQFACYSTGGDPYTWKEENKGWSTPDINAMLIKWGYHPVNKRTAEKPFDICWDYRIICPKWSLFRLWLYVFYAHKEAPTERGGALGNAYLEVMGKLGTLGDACPLLSDILRWAEFQETLYELAPNREIKYVYAGLATILSAYAGWAGVERVNS